MDNSLGDDVQKMFEHVNADTNLLVVLRNLCQDMENLRYEMIGGAANSGTNNAVLLFGYRSSRRRVYLGGLEFKIHDFNGFRFKASDDPGEITRYHARQMAEVLYARKTLKNYN